MAAAAAAQLPAAAAAAPAGTLEVDEPPTVPALKRKIDGALQVFDDLLDKFTEPKPPKRQPKMGEYEAPGPWAPNKLSTWTRNSLVYNGQPQVGWIEVGELGRQIKTSCQWHPPSRGKIAAREAHKRAGCGPYCMKPIYQADYLWDHLHNQSEGPLKRIKTALEDLRSDTVILEVTITIIASVFSQWAALLTPRCFR